MFRIFRMNTDGDIYEDNTKDICAYIKKEFNITYITIEAALRFFQEEEIKVIKED